MDVVENDSVDVGRGRHGGKTKGETCERYGKVNLMYRLVRYSDRTDARLVRYLLLGRASANRYAVLLCFTMLNC